MGEATEIQRLRRELLAERAAHQKTKQSVSGLKSVNQKLRVMLHAHSAGTKTKLEPKNAELRE
jgi:hypothetical protein